jgi:hypothetical protein
MVLNVFTAGPTYDLAVNKLPDFTTVLYAELVVQRLSLPTIQLMREMRRRRQR